jgi:uncharacterized DUF497 family protein
MTSEIRELEFDNRNLEHLAPRGIDPNLVLEILAGEPVVAANEPKSDRSGSHLMIGPAANGRHWTIVIVEVDEDLGIWRPITGWPSTRKEIQLWHAEN